MSTLPQALAAVVALRDALADLPNPDASEYRATLQNVASWIGAAMPESEARECADLLALAQE